MDGAVRTFLVLVASLTGVSACGPLPPATASLAELPGLRSRTERSYSDGESLLRLSAGMWAQGDQQGAVDLLREARVTVPENTAYVAALGVAMEGLGQYLDARAQYLDFVTHSAPSGLSETLTDRIDLIRGETAAPLVREITESGGQLSHGFNPDNVAALLPFNARGNDAELDDLASAATELLFLELREAGPLPILDWELAAAVAEATGAPGRLAGTADSVARQLDSHRVVWGELERNADAGVTFRLFVLRALSSGPAEVVQDSVLTTLNTFQVDRTSVARRVWEMLTGTAAGTAVDWIAEADSVPVAAVLALGAGLRASQAGDRVEAREHLVRAGEIAPEFTPAALRLAQIEAIEAFRESPELPLAETILEFARQRSAMAALWLDSAGPGANGLSAPRAGSGEVFGLDRLGAQVFADFVLRLGGDGE